MYLSMSRKMVSIGPIRTVEPHTRPRRECGQKSPGLWIGCGSTARYVRMESLWRGRLWLGPQGLSETSLGEAGNQLRTCVSRNE